MKNILSRFKKKPTKAHDDGQWRTSEITDPAGRKWKVFGSDDGTPPMISQGRYIPASLAILKAENILTPEDQVKRIDDLLNFFDKGQVGNIAAVLHEWKSRLLLCPPLPSLLELATVYVMFPDENPERYSPNLANEKIKIWNEDPDVQFFFANLARIAMPNLSNISAGDFQTALMVQEARRAITDEYISKYLSATN